MPETNPRCELCWKEIDRPFEHDGITMCEECYARAVPTLDDLKKTLLAGNEDVWRGTYLTESGNRIRCHDCFQFDEYDWLDCDEEMVGSVYFEIDEFDEETGKYTVDCEGGEFGYTAATTFADFCEVLTSWHCEWISQKISDSDSPDE